MYGLPSQTLGQWQTTLNEVLSLSPEHLSLYCLTLEEGTPMEKEVRLGEIPLPDPDLAADMYMLAEDLLEQSGYHHYEISNWARPGKESRHNLTYWRNQPYLGVGPGAHSYLAGHRFHNVKSPRAYTRRLEGGGDETLPEGNLGEEHIRGVPVVETVEPIDRRLEMAETMMLGLLVGAAGLALHQPPFLVFRAAVMVAAGCFASGILLIGLTGAIDKGIMRLRAWWRAR